MKKMVLPLLISMAVIPSISHAEIKLSTGEGVNILAINGKAIDQGTLFSGAPELKADNGKTQIVAEYTAEISDSADDYRLENSDTFVITFSAANTTVQVHAPEISSAYDLKAFNESGEWTLQDKDGHSISFDYGKLEKEGFQLSRDYESELKKFNNTQSDAAMISLNHETHSFNKGTPAQSVSNSINPDQKMVGQMLQFWYEQASTETQNKFKSWIKSGQ
ncbi:DUF2057 domain-containing protein [Marinobacterium sp. MBR-109]|uniref:YccT family protein n=1 Tax=Marinobacterium sp. MBR-109 TaxID=3156462 RepID=UPI00339403CE